MYFQLHSILFSSLTFLVLFLSGPTWVQAHKSCFELELATDQREYIYQYHGKKLGSGRFGHVYRGQHTNGQYFIFKIYDDGNAFESDVADLGWFREVVRPAGVGETFVVPKVDADSERFVMMRPDLLGRELRSILRDPTVSTERKTALRVSYQKKIARLIRLVQAHDPKIEIKNAYGDEFFSDPFKDGLEIKAFVSPKKTLLVKSDNIIVEDGTDDMHLIDPY